MKKVQTKKTVILAFAVALALALATVFSGSFMPASAAKHDTPEFGNYYTSDYRTRNEAQKAGSALNEEITAEGFTLLKNESNALPVAAGAKISLFGKNSAQMLTGGSGSGAGGGGGDSVSLQQSFIEAGFSLNPALVSFYNDNAQSGNGRGNAPTNGNVSPGYNTGETPMSMYTDAVKDSLTGYTDAAVVIFSRIGGEGFDLPRTMKWNGSSYGSWGNDATQKVPGARSTDDHYLQLDQNEADLLKFCGDRFDKVIVLLNTGSQFECGFLDDPGHYAYHENIKAALWIGYPGGTGIRALGKILKGEITPSGHTVDTYARDFKADPVWQNFANNMMEGDSSKKGNQYANLPGSGGNGGGGYRNNYVVYKEGVYMGYRYYETRCFDAGSAAWSGDDKRGNAAVSGTATTAWDNWYDAHVVYPFGHGLSYTTFTQEIKTTVPAADTALDKDGNISVTVTVTNTGKTYSGKEVVQLYYTAPYNPKQAETAIEKPHVALGAFEKTRLLAPGESQEVTLTMKVRDMASYDWKDANTNQIKGYELEAGSYALKVMSDSHNVLDSVNFTVASDVHYETDDVGQGEIENRFDYVSNKYDDYMSRGDWEGTFPATALRLTASDDITKGLTDLSMGGWQKRAADADESEKYYNDTMPTTGAHNDLMLDDMIGKSYDDPQWSDFLDQFTADQYKQLACGGSYGSGQNFAELGVTRGINADGPAGFSVGAPSGKYALYCCDTVLASTWNKELAEKKGNAIGNEALWAKVIGWYAPAVNIHRSPFSGRNFEYFSEDGHVTGMMSANVVKGAQDYGLFCYVKHFGLNDQESNRCGLLTWANEQSMREIYFKGFELAVKVGKSRAMMSSLNRIGYEWAGGSYELLTELLRNEWGFRGNVVTDSYSTDWGPADHMIRGGGNLALGGANLVYNTSSATTVNCLREAAHGILYAHANSMAMNTAPTPTSPDKIDNYIGKILQVGIVNGTYREDVGTATLSRILYPDADDSEIAYALADGSRLPRGLSMDGAGIITGSPSEEVNSHRFTVAASYDNFTKTAEFVVSIINPNGSIIYEAERELGFATIGAASDLSVAGARIYKPGATQEEIDSFPPVTYAIKNGSLLPDGLSLTSAGKIAGTPTKEAPGYTFTVVASALGYKAVEMEFTMDVGYSLTFGTKTLSTARFGANYVERVQLAECANDVTYTLKTGSELPKGLTLTKAGYITGTPLETVTDHTFVVAAAADYAQTVETEYKITVGISFNATALPDGKAGKLYGARVDTAQGAGNVKYALKGSALPDGLTLNEDGTIAGTPTKAGVYTLTFEANADGLASDEMTLTLYIANADASEESGCGGNLAGTLGVVGGMLGIGAAVVTLAAVKKRREKRDK